MSKWHPPECQDPKFLWRTLPRAIHCLGWIAFFPIVYSEAISSPAKQNTNSAIAMMWKMWVIRPGHLHAWSSSETHVPTVGTPQWTGFSISTLSGLQLCCLIHNNLQWNVCSYTFCTTKLLSGIGSPLFHMPITEHWAPMTLSLVQQFSFLFNKHCLTGTPPQDLLFWSFLPFSHHNLAIVNAAQMLAFAHVSGFQHINFNERLFSHCRIYPTPC